MADTVHDLAGLEAIYGRPVPNSVNKVVTRITPLYRKWIETSRLVMLATVGPDGTDCSPRGDKGPVVRLHSDTVLLLPDWHGNNRIDSLRNIVRDGRVSLMFLIPGVNNVVRINGTAEVVIAPDVVQSFEQKGKHPRSVIRVTVGEAYFQCSKAFLRSRAWVSGDESDGVPKAGEFLREQIEGFDAEDYDKHYVERAQDRMW
jgi:PPOX class probable FMN-dependent enzyme